MMSGKGTSSMSEICGRLKIFNLEEKLILFFLLTTMYAQNTIKIKILNFNIIHFCFLNELVFS